MKTGTVESAGKVLDVLLLLMRSDYYTGLAPGEIAREVKLSPSAVTRYIATLEDRGCVERAPDTGRLRPSVVLAQHASGILASLDTHGRRIQELATRIGPTRY